MNRIDAYQGQKIIGWKKAKRLTKNGNVYFVLIKLEIGARTRRVQPYDEKCRAASARVLEIVTLPSIASYYSANYEVGGRKVTYAYAGRQFHNKKERFKYILGEIVKPVKKFDPEPRDECRSGIHFFLTKLEAERYHL